MTQTFKEWFWENLSDCAEDIANHGADSGFPHLTYTHECARIFDQFADEIWNMAVEEADSMGEKNVCAMIAGFNRSDMCQDWHQFKNLLLWYAAESVARENDRPESEDEDAEETETSSEAVSE